MNTINTNLLFKRKYIFDKPKEIKKFYKQLSPDIRKFNKLCLKYEFKQLIDCPNRTTCSTNTLIDHFLTNTEEYVSQSGTIDVAILDH